MNNNNPFLPPSSIPNPDQPIKLHYYTGDLLGLVKEVQGIVIGFRRVETKEEWEEATRVDKQWREENNLPLIEYPEFQPPARVINVLSSVEPVSVTVTEENWRKGKMLYEMYEKRFGKNHPQ